VAAILDAMATLVAEGGLENVTMHGLAEVARTSIGSLYHFFPDRDNVLRALEERHAAAMGDITAKLHAIPLAVWRDASVDEVAWHLTADYLNYLRAHPDYFPIMVNRRLPHTDAVFVALLNGVLSIRLPGANSATCTIYANTIHALLLGGITMAYQSGPAVLSSFMTEMPRVLKTYLADLERQQA